MRKRDYWNECYDRETPEREFRATFCNHCRNPECALAGWSKDLFSQRVQAQEDLLFKPKRGMTNKPLSDFGDLMRKAVRLEIADRRGDWSMPEDPPMGFVRELGPNLADIPPQSANARSQDNIQDSLRALKQESHLDFLPQNLASKSHPNEPKQNSGGREHHDTADLHEESRVEPQFASSNKFDHLRSSNVESPLEKEDILAEGKNIKNPDGPHVEIEETPKTPKVVSRPAQNTDYNTPLHWAGIMLDGSRPSLEPAQKPKVQEQKPDPWAVKPKPKFQEPGARIRFGGNKNGKK
tara:strand:+ start:2191 stop:3075 length:885 start_codon:yes stop_codon:yes gene_type:complete